MAQENVEEVKTSENPEVPSTPPVEDAEALLLAANKRAEEAEKRARDFQKGYQKYKTLAQEREMEKEEDQNLPVGDLVQREVARQLAETQAVQALKERDDLALKLARENKELKLALGNRSQMTSSQGAGGSNIEVQDSFFTAEQLADMKRRGWTPEKIEKHRQNLRQYRQFK